MIIDKFKDEYVFLRNDFPCSIIIQLKSGSNVICSSAENAYQLLKVIDIVDDEKAKEIAKAKMHELRTIMSTFQIGDIDRIKLMKQALLKKFKNFELAYRLMKTEDSEILQSGHNNTFWGSDNNGENNMGILLMQIRSELKAQYGSALELFKCELLKDCGVKYSAVLPDLK